jgi:hypothetical protein
VNITIPQPEYGPPHPEGNHRGTIVGIDMKEFQTQYGKWNPVEIVIENLSVRDEDGELFKVRKYCSLSSHKDSNLLKFRELMKGTKLNSEELESFQDAELLDRKVGFVVLYKPHQDGGTFPSIESIWPLDDGQNPSKSANEDAAS